MRLSRGACLFNRSSAKRLRCCLYKVEDNPKAKFFFETRDVPLTLVKSHLKMIGKACETTIDSVMVSPKLLTAPPEYLHKPPVFT